MPHLGLKRNLSKIWPPPKYGRKIVLLYHSLGKSHWALSKNHFVDHINWLFDNCLILPLNDLINAKFNADIQIALTFDDGYASLYQQALPILQNKKMVATVYINTGWIGENINARKLSNAALGHHPNDEFLIWPEVKDLHCAGWEIGSHGINHYDFTSTSIDLTREELKCSRLQIEKRLETTCLHFAYPFGKHSKQLKRIVKESGYQYAAGAKHGSLSKQFNLLSFPRISISNDYSFDDFKNIIKGKWDYLGWIHTIRGL